ncbi:hypothetical protein JNM87_03995 [Candidatus Saccharibacteria bacterium]|nr:hypothetical protein [Candidatus Saccharibacteria bacterium]
MSISARRLLRHKNSQSNTLYQNGTYISNSINYWVHGHSNYITTTLTVTNDHITAVSANHSVSDGTSQNYVDAFDNDLGGAAIGQPLQSISLSRVGGASVTTDGFNDSLSSIRSQAST